MASTQTINLDPSSQEYRATLSLIRSIGIAGGEAGFRQWAAAPKVPDESPYSDGSMPPEFPNHTAIIFHAGRIGINFFEVQTTELSPNWTGNSGCWLSSVKDTRSFPGELYYAESFPTFARQTVGFRVVPGPGVGAVLFQFLNDADAVIGEIAIAIRDGAGLAGMRGMFHWKEDLEE